MTLPYLAGQAALSARRAGPCDRVLVVLVLVVLVLVVLVLVVMITVSSVPVSIVGVVDVVAVRDRLVPAAWAMHVAVASMR
jgi:hypothetical protein